MRETVMRLTSRTAAGVAAAMAAIALLTGPAAAAPAEPCVCPIRDQRPAVLVPVEVPVDDTGDEVLQILVAALVGAAVADATTMLSRAVRRRRSHTDAARAPTVIQL
jgi:hypothetical protein